MHNPPCETWTVHSRRCWVEKGEAWTSLRDLIDDTLHSWEEELLLADPEFAAEFERVTAETRAAMDAAR